MAIEGGSSGWKMGMDLLQEYIRMVAVKDLASFREKDEKTGQKVWKARVVPLGEGLVRWAEVFSYLHEVHFDGPVSVHSEYDRLKFEDLISQTKRDIEYLKEILKKTFP